MGQNVLHADDAGLSSDINEAILNLAKRGRLASISIIANSEYTAQFCNDLKQIWPQLKQKPDIFLHFNLIECRPLTDWPVESARIDPSGNFYYGYGGMIRSILKKRIQPVTVKKELEAQYNVLKDLGMEVIGIDSHQHMHALAPVAEVVRQFAKEHGLRQIRSYEDMHCQTLKGRLKKILFSLIAITTELAYSGRPILPNTWRGHTWRIFYMASWEKVSDKALKRGEVIAFHPGSDVDNGFEPDSTNLSILPASSR